ncbi:RNA-directed DNA polymerase, eukaryota, reverse transcriptase zinc-binding domain protein [Tanacetum coccineum]
MAIKGILNNGEWIEDPVHVKDAFLCHFSTRFQQPAGIPPSLDTDSFTPLSSSKVLANRLRTVIGSCITSVQSAFIQGRNILDGPLILNKVLSWYRDRLHAFICKVEKLGLFKGASIGRDNMNISHLMYADDVIFFGDASYMANIIGCGVATLPLKYLGVLVGCNMTRCLYWNDIIQKFSSKLSLWKARLLSVGGHLSLTKSVLGLATFGLRLFSAFMGPQEVFLMVLLAVLTILSSISNLKYNGIDLISFCTRKIGNGESTRFWNDVWCGISPLKVQYPSIFLLDTDKDCFISNRVSLPDWHAVLRRVPRGGAEMSQFVALQAALGNISLTNQCDSWKWSINGSGSFFVASVRSLVDHHTLDMDQEVTRWNGFIPIKVNVFLWRLKLNKLPSRVNRDRKGIELDSILCPICHGDVETVNHIFFNCDMAKDLWSLLAS